MSERAPRRPHRPAVPPTLYALATAMASAYAVMAAGGASGALRELADAATERLPLLAACALVVAGAVCARLRLRGGAPTLRHGGASSSMRAAHTRAVSGVVALVVLVTLAGGAGALCASAALANGALLVDALSTSDLGGWDLTVVSDPSQTDRGAWRCRVHASRAGCPAGDLWLTTEASCEIGDVVHVTSGFVANADDEWGRINRSQGVWGRIMPKGTGALRVGEPQGYRRIVRLLRDAARTLIDPYSSEARAILAGCVIGDRRAMDALGLSEVFSACGVSHLIAVSGGHIVIMAQVLGLLLERTRLTPTPRLLLLALLSGLYVLLTGAPSPAVRSWVMAVVTYGAQLAGRRADSLSAAALAGLAMVLTDPGSAGQMGFVLSVVCVVCLCLLAGYATYALEVLLPGSSRVPRRAPRALRRRLMAARETTCETLGATVVAQLATMPVTIPVFMQASLVAPLANLLLTLPFTVLIGAGLLACCLPLPAPLATLVLAPCDMVANATMVLLRLVATLPFASIPLALDATLAALVGVTAGVALLVVWPTLTRARAVALVGGACAVLVAYVVRWGLLVPARVVVLDIGQGDAILVQDGASAVLVDAGPDSAIRAALARNHVLRLDAVILTHLHDDHYGGVGSLPGFVGVGSVLVPDGVGEGDAGDAASYNGSELGKLRDAVGALTGCVAPGELALGDVVQVGGFCLRVVWPHGPVAGTENAESLELLVSYAGRDGSALTALLTGDAERDETAAACAAADVGSIDVLKVGHHGSAVSLDGPLAQALSPLVAVASAGEGNRYGHPKAACVELLEDVGARFLCTKDVGDVCVEPGGSGVRVSCQRSAG